MYVLTSLIHFLFSASVDGRFFVWNITEGPDEEEKPQILGKIVVAIQILSDGESLHPRVCWHPHKQVIILSQKQMIISYFFIDFICFKDQDFLYCLVLDSMVLLVTVLDFLILVCRKF